MRNEIIEYLNSVDLLPAYVGQIITELQKTDVDLSAVVELIKMDPSLTASVLKLVNSSAFVGGYPISTIQDASVRMGSFNLMQMVIGSSMSSIMSKHVPGYDLPPGELWKSSITAAIFTDVINDVLQLSAPAHAFTAALLRDVGKIVLGSYIQIDAQVILSYAADNKVSFPEAEHAVLGIDHAEVGAELMQLWRLPEQLCTPVRWHHCPEMATDDKKVTCIVHLADILTSIAGSGIGNEGLLYNVSPIVVDELQLNHDDVENILCEGMSQVSIAMEMFST